MDQILYKSAARWFKLTTEKQHVVAKRHFTSLDKCMANSETITTINNTGYS